MARYLESFFRLRCAPDVLAATGPIFHGDKEITEAMAVIEAIRSKTLSAPMEYDLLDVCSGNALVPILAAHLLPVARATAVDIKKRSGRYERVKRFTYVETSFQDHNVMAPTILTAVHPCKELACDAAMYATSRLKVKMAVIMPCCVGPICYSKVVANFAKLSKYERFALDIALYMEDMGWSVTCQRDTHVLSPANMVIVAERR